jgi:hypothetical protein
MKSNVKVDAQSKREVVAVTIEIPLEGDRVELIEAFREAIIALGLRVELSRNSHDVLCQVRISRT